MIRLSRESQSPNILCEWQPFVAFPHCGWLGSPSKASVWSLDLEGGSPAAGEPWDGGFSIRETLCTASFS